MCENTNDFSGVKVGDKLWSVQLGDCWVRVTDDDGTLFCECDNDGAWFVADGGAICRGNFGDQQSLFWSRPEIIAPPKPKRRVVKTVEMDVRVDRCGAIHRLRSGQGIPAGNNRVHLTGTYEVEE